MSSLRCYTHDQILAVWPRVKGHIQRALDEGSNYTLDEIYKMLRKKEAQLWVYQSDGCRSEIHAAMVTSIQDQHCLLLTIAGDKMDEWKTHLPVVEKWAKENNCTELRIYGRHGWARALNFETIYTKMRKTL